MNANEMELFNEWKECISHRYNFISEPSHFEWRTTQEMASDGTRYELKSLYAEITMQWRKGSRKVKGLQFITAIYQ